jgi:DNA replication protein DnaC
MLLKFPDFEMTDSNAELFMVAERYVRTQGWIDKKGFALLGNVGVGKTMLSMIVTNEAIRYGKSVLYLPTFALMRELRDAQLSQDRTAYNKRYDELVNADILILDDVGKEKPTDWVKQEYFSIIEKRYREGKPIGFTSNYRIKDLVDRLGENGDAIISRLIAMTKGFQVYSQGKDYRVQKRG